MSLTSRIKAEAHRLGFDLVGVLPAGPSLTHPFYTDWLARGYAGEMAYLERHAEAKADLRRLAPEARTVILLAINYHRPDPPAAPHSPHRGRISRYAWGRDYHDILQEKLAALGRFADEAADVPVRSWSYVDSAPVMEREFAARAGLGWVGKHGVLINWRQGSWLFLGELLLDLELDYDQPPPGTGGAGPAGQAFRLEDLRESCGSCTACIDACPTDAIVAEKTVDSRLCISYHTIELKGPIPEEFRPHIDEWIFGCDICQDVCPWNRRAPDSTESEFTGAGERAAPSLLRLLALDEQGFRREFAGTALLRSKRRGLLRNAAIALGNRLARESPEADPDGRESAMHALRRSLNDPEPLIRGAAAWALGRSGHRGAKEDLQQALLVEQDHIAREEMEKALAPLL